jgi:hypothetical protein
MIKSIYIFLEYLQEQFAAADPRQSHQVAQQYVAVSVDYDDED